MSEESIKEKVDLAFGLAGAMTAVAAASPIAGGRYVLGRLDGESHQTASEASDRIASTAGEVGAELGQNHGGTILSAAALAVGMSPPKS